MKSTGKLIIFIFTFLALAASAYAADDNPLHLAVARGDKAAVEALLAKGADVNAQMQGAGVLEYWAMSSAVSTGRATLSEAKDIAELLIAKGADVNAKGLFEETPLHKAAAFGRKDAAELLLAKGADINAKNINKYTPLHSAASTGMKDVVELLLYKGADVNAKNNLGQTPLDMAVEKGMKDVAELLKEYPVKQAQMLEYIKSNPRAAFVQMADKLKVNPTDDSTRRLIIKLASEMKPVPAIPEEARKHFVEGIVIGKAAERAQKVLAVQSFTEALKIAPWWGDAYYNLGVVQELAEKYDEAEQAFNFYLLSNPSEAEKREVQDRIYGLSAKRKLAGVK